MRSHMQTRFRKLILLLPLVVLVAATLGVFLQVRFDDAPIRSVRDRFPVFADVAVDPESNIVAVTDENLFSLRTYDRDLLSNDVADPRTVITGPKSRVDFVCGVAVDPKNREIYAVNNDTAADVVVFKYDTSGNVPASRTLRPAPVSTWGVGLDLKNDEIAVTVQQTNKVLVYRRVAEGDENPLRIIQGPDTGLADPHGIFITPDDRIFLTDRDAHQILIYDTDGKQRGSIGERHHARFGAPFNHPTDVAVAANGDIYVSDGYGNAHVHWFSADGTHKKTWGGVGTGPGLFSTPHGIWVTRDNKVLVGDRENNRIQVFSADGAYLSEWGDLYHPMDIWGDADGTIYVTDQAPRIVAFSPRGEIIGRCKVVATWSHGLWGDAAGNLYCSEHNGQLTKLARLT